MAGSHAQIRTYNVAKPNLKQYPSSFYIDRIVMRRLRGYCEHLGCSVSAYVRTILGCVDWTSDKVDHIILPIPKDVTPDPERLRAVLNETVDKIVAFYNLKHGGSDKAR